MVARGSPAAVGSPTPTLDCDTATPSDLTPAPAAGGPPVGAGRYQVLRLHRAGGLGQVWLARDTAVGRDVALKTLRPDRAGQPGPSARFVREARVTGQLEHPCVVPLYDLGAGRRPDPCYVMRFVAGRTLAEAAADYHRGRAAGRAGPLDLAGLLDAFVAVCRAVAFAHARGVLHRDLKGQNVVLGEFGEVFLLDWGLAQGGRRRRTRSARPAGADADGARPAPGSIVGTPAYMAPEVGGRASRRRRASDVYGLGAVLYSILTGRPPYGGPTAADVLEKVIGDRPAAGPVG